MICADKDHSANLKWTKARLGERLRTLKGKLLKSGKRAEKMLDGFRDWVCILKTIQNDSPFEIVFSLSLIILSGKRAE